MRVETLRNVLAGETWGVNIALFEMEQVLAEYDTLKDENDTLKARVRQLEHDLHPRRESMNLSDEQLADELVGECPFCGEHVELYWKRDDKLGSVRVCKKHGFPARLYNRRRARFITCPGTGEIANEIEWRRSA